MRRGFWFRLFAVNLRIVKLNPKANSEANDCHLATYQGIRMRRRLVAAMKIYEWQKLSLLHSVSSCRCCLTVCPLPCPRLPSWSLPTLRLLLWILLQLLHRPRLSSAPAQPRLSPLNDKTNYEIFKMLNFCWVLPRLAVIQLATRVSRECFGKVEG